MELLLIGLVALLAAGVTLFSGFGLGTVLTPVFALFFPVPLAIAATAVVHLANNLFKLALMAKHADWRVALRFGLPAALAALAGAGALRLVESLPVLATYQLGGKLHEVTAIKATIGILIVTFALLEMSERFRSLALPAKWLPLGGLLSGFFGGLSGNQGALRSAFLVKAGLSKEAFVATGVVSAVLVDLSRLLVYGAAFGAQLSSDLLGPILVGTLCAFIGTFAGARLLLKVTLRTVQWVVAAAMFLIGIGLASGWI